MIETLVCLLAATARSD